MEFFQGRRSGSRKGLLSWQEQQRILVVPIPVFLPRMQVRCSQSKGGTRTLVTHKGKATRTPEILKGLSMRASGVFLGERKQLLLFNTPEGWIFCYLQPNTFLYCTCVMPNEEPDAEIKPWSRGDLPGIPVATLNQNRKYGSGEGESPWLPEIGVGAFLTCPVLSCA